VGEGVREGERCGEDGIEERVGERGNSHFWERGRVRGGEEVEEKE
jgi:hypothetical protein